MSFVIKQQNTTYHLAKGHRRESGHGAPEPFVKQELQGVLVGTTNVHTLKERPRETLQVIQPRSFYKYIEE